MNEDEEIIDIGDDQVKQEAIKNTLSIEQIEWTEPAQTVDTDMDEESRKLIEQMLAEEEYYYGTDTISALNSTKKKKRKPSQQAVDSQTKKSKKEGLSSASMPSHKTRWTEEEDQRLKEALARYSYGNWKLISEYVKTRNPLQCKNHARHLQQTDKIDPEIQSKPIPVIQQTPSQPQPLTPPTPPQQQQPLQPLQPLQQGISEKAGNKENDEDDDDDELSIDDNMSISHEITGTEQKDIPDGNRDEEMPLIEYKEAVLDNQDKILDNEDNAPYNEDNAPYNEDNEPNNEEKVSSNEEKAPSNEGKVPDNQDETPDNKETILGNEETVPNEIKRESESSFSPYVITEDEKFNNPEWFRQKHSKTPDRYLKIRNHMLACWEQCKPRYLTKTSARKGLKDCGDVNAIGRVHEYLESIGAININCVTSAPRPPKRTFREKLELDDKDMFDAAELVIGYDGPRKRKVRNEHGDWVDPKELEGRVIEHDQVITRLDSKPKRIMKRSPHHHYYGGDDFGRGHDPFRLVPTLHYDEETPAPFEVEIVSDALLVMDFHSHLAHTEIIGLLGGNFIRRGESKILQVKTVFPCQSTSTGIQCEMDPASEMKARDEFAEKGFNVVGWYHSHPTFEPHPSIRDIENQTSYQTLFREEKTGDEPFIGVIVTPYDPETQSDHSQIQYLHISKEWNEIHSFRVPYACRRTVIQSEQVSQNILQQIVALIHEYKDYEHKMNMLDPFGSQTRLEKLLDSLKAHLFVSEQDEQAFLVAVKDAILKDFVDKEASGAATESARIEEPSAQ